MIAGRYRFAPIHFPQRLRERGETLDSVKMAIQAGTIAPYPGGNPEHGGTCWRVTGMGTNGAKIAVGVELFPEADGEWTVLCTVFPVPDRKKSKKGRRR